MTEAEARAAPTVAQDPERAATIGYQGEPGAYSEEAASALFPGSATRGCRTFRLAFDALTDGSIEAAVLPVENTLGGIVQEVNDLLWETPGLRVTGEYVHPIVHCLMGRRDAPVRRAMSHPQGLAQCRRWLHEHGIEEVVGQDTAGSARWLSEHPSPGLAAIASAAAARRYRLDVLAEGIQDDDSNRTRFLVVDRGLPVRPAAVSGRGLCSLAFVAAHRPGSLVAALRCLSERGVNLTRLDSRPIADRPFEYRFYLDFQVTDPGAAEVALQELETEAAEVRLFGTFPAAD
jgi:prephenate dehydratase